jgi:hypothetical protein
MRPEKMSKIPTIVALVFGLGGLPAISLADTFLFTVTPSAPLVGTSTVPLLDVSIGVSGLTTQSLGSYDLTLSFNPTLLAHISSNYGDPVLGDQLELNQPSIKLPPLAPPGTGTVEVAEVSTDSETDLNTLQLDSFIVAVLHLRPIGQGITPLTLMVNAAGDPLGNPVTTAVLGSSVQTVPEPGVFLLVSFGLAVVFASRRRLHS